MPTLLIERGKKNWLYVTATELATTDNPYFKFVFQHDQQKKKIEVVLLDQSEYKESYNLFELNEPTDAKFDINGQYEYRIYDNNGEQVEIGKAEVFTSETVKEFAFPYKNENNIVYAS